MPMPNLDLGHGFCWDTPGQPAPELLKALKSGPFKSTSGAQLSDLTAVLRRETVNHPVIYVGVGTCGLGAGADKTLEQIRPTAPPTTWTWKSARWVAWASVPKSQWWTSSCPAGPGFPSGT